MAAIRDPDEAVLRQYLDVDYLFSSLNRDAGGASDPIVLEASAPGLVSGTVNVATSVDPSDAVLEVASKFGSKPVFFD